MTPKERAAMQQALEALEGDWNAMKKARAALREALAEQEKPLYRKVLREMLDAHEQAEQEPVECERCEELAADKGTWYRMAERFAIRNEELKKVLGRALRLVEGEWPEGDETAQPVIDAMKATLANQPAPVRTKDLTDDEIVEALGYDKSYRLKRWVLDDARAVIAAYKEKNK